MLGAFAKNGSFGLLDVFIRFTTLNIDAKKKNCKKTNVSVVRILPQNTIKPSLSS